jgi:Ca2+-binding EF-hand superfamily protein
MKKALLLACVLGLGGGSVALAHGGLHGPFARIDADGDGKVTLAEMQKMAGDHFAQVDANKDGRVTKEELASFGEQMRSKHEGDRSARMDERFAERDTNKDGKLSRQEVQRMPDQFFARVDTNKDGFLSKEELAAGKQAMHEHAGGWFAHRVEAEFTRADANNDGAVDSKELQTAVATRFAALDENHDGALAREEMHHGFAGGECGQGHHGFGGHGQGHEHGNPGSAPAGTAGSGAQQ